MSKSGCVLLILASLAACGPRGAQTESPARKAARLIDLDRPDEAIELLEPEVANAPDDPETRLTLVTAYAAKVGITAKSLHPVYERGRAYLEQLNKIFADLPTEKGQSPNAIEKKLEALGRLNLAVTAGAELITLIPKLDSKKAGLLRNAIMVLDGGGQTRRPSDRLYAAVLRAVLLKHVLVTRLSAETERISIRNKSDAETGREIETVGPAKPCKIDLLELTELFREATEIVVDGTSDLSEAFPDSAQEILTAGDGLAVALGALTTGTGALMIADEVAIAFIQQQIFAPGLGELIRCPKPESPAKPDTEAKPN